MGLETAKTAREMDNHEEAQALAMISIGEELKKIRKQLEEDDN